MLPELAPRAAILSLRLTSTNQNAAKRTGIFRERPLFNGWIDTLMRIVLFSGGSA